MLPVVATFGSFGDIVSLCLIIKDLVKAIDDSRGACAEYQEIIKEVWALDRILLLAEDLWRPCEANIELIGLREMARHITHQCRSSIEKFLEKLKKYGPKLSDGGSGSSIRNTKMKIRWQVES